MNEFDLLKQSVVRDKDNQWPVLAESIEFRIGMGAVAAGMFSYFTLDLLNLDLPDWGDFVMALSITIGYGYAFISLLLSRNAGKVNVSTQRISIQPKRDAENYPTSPIYIDKDSEIRIYLMKSIRFGLHRTLLHLQVTNGEEQSDFGIVLKNKKEHQQYLAVLESWYRAGFNVHEFDQLGGRVFKLNQGKNYAEVQKIKQEYGIDWQ